MIRALAEEGLEGARRLLRAGAETDPELRERLERLRLRLRRQADRRVDRIVTDYDTRIAELDQVRSRSDADVAARIAALEARLAAARSVDWSKMPPTDLFGDVETALLLPDASWNRPPAPAGFAARLRALLARCVAWLRSLFSRRRAGRPAAPAGRTVTFAVASGAGRGLGPSDLGDALARLSPPQREELSENVSNSLRSRERDLQKEAEERRRAADAQRRALEEERAEAERRARAETEARVKQGEARRLERELKERGFVAERGASLVVTFGLVERFARLLLEEETRRLPEGARLSLRGEGSTGVYEKARLRRAEEIAHLDLPGSLLAARQAGQRHIDESTSYVYREITAERVHVVLAFDRSGSMEESGKLDAAKKALLALYVAIRRRHPEATIDLLAFDNDVEVLDLVTLWECKAGSFTNTGEALRAAHLLLQASRANRREFYLLTDGLPESYTGEDGKVHSGQLDVAMEQALVRAGELATVRPLRSTMVLLKSAHPEYETAARAIARTLGGELVVTDPGRLGVELLVRWAHGVETERRLLPPAPLPPERPSPGRDGARARRRKGDRRMGG
ncbi:MAG: VWA domain-containing protein [Thermoplasmata archaeon]|nr:VWA domain-containing protein [Thermoplasmata archaeon]